MATREITLGYVAWLVRELMGFHLLKLADTLLVDGEILFLSALGDFGKAVIT